MWESKAGWVGQWCSNSNLKYRGGETLTDINRTRNPGKKLKGLEKNEVHV